MQTNKKGFLKLLDRYLKNQATDPEKETIDIWYGTIQREEKTTAPPEHELKSQMWQDISARMHQGTVRETENVTEKRWWQTRHYQVAAASVLLLFGFFFYRSLTNKSTLISGVPDAEIAGMIRELNTNTFAKQIRLSDGSQITLEPGAALFYPPSFEKNARVVYLKGNGFFNITKDPEKPFLVYTDDILTKVLGTSFKIARDQTKGLVEVSVATGKVSVEKVDGDDHDASSPANRGIILTPNKKVIYYTETEKYVVGLVEKPQIIEKQNEFRKPESFVFKGTPLLLIIDKLEKAYGVQISVENEDLNTCTITADISQDDLYGKLEVICAAVNAKFELQGDKINLTGQGCDHK